MQNFKYLLISAVLVMPMQAFAHGDFSTEATVRFVLDCMAENGGLTDENFYYCTCKHDAIEDEVSFSDYEEGITYERNKPMPGEKGGVFRGIKRGEEKLELVNHAREMAETQCSVVTKVTR